MTAAPVPAELVEFAERWQIVQFAGGLDVISAEQRAGDGSLRYVVAPTPAELAAKLTEAEAEDTSD
jgi:hypothetical protein